MTGHDDKRIPTPPAWAVHLVQRGSTAHPPHQQQRPGTPRWTDGYPSAASSPAAKRCLGPTHQSMWPTRVTLYYLTALSEKAADGRRAAGSRVGEKRLYEHDSRCTTTCSGPGSHGWRRPALAASGTTGSAT